MIAASRGSDCIRMHPGLGHSRKKNDVIVSDSVGGICCISSAGAGGREGRRNELHQDSCWYDEVEMIWKESVK